MDPSPSTQPPSSTVLTDLIKNMGTGPSPSAAWKLPYSLFNNIICTRRLYLYLLLLLPYCCPRFNTLQ